MIKRLVSLVFLEGSSICWDAIRQRLGSCTFLFTLVACVGCQGPDYTIVKTQGGEVVIPAKCEKAIKYGARAWGIGGVKIPVKMGSVSLPAEIGNVYSKYEAIREASQIAEILDGRRVENCRLLQVGANLSPERRILLITQIQKDNARIEQLAMCLAAAAEKCVAQWWQSYNQLGAAIRSSGEKAVVVEPHLERVVPFDVLIR